MKQLLLFLILGACAQPAYAPIVEWELVPTGWKAAMLCEEKRKTKCFKLFSYVTGYEYRIKDYKEFSDED